MKAIKAYVQRYRAADVIEAIRGTKAWVAHHGGPEQHHLAISAVQGTLQAQDLSEQHYSVALGLEVVNEFRLELHCDDDCVEELVEAICSSGRTGQERAGWVYVTDIVVAREIR